MIVILTWEVYKNELEQPKQIYLRKSDGINYCFDVHRGLLPREWLEAIWTTIRVDEDWELVREEVDFMTAINSGKNIKSCICQVFHDEEWYRVAAGLTLEEINGKWLIE